MKMDEEDRREISEADIVMGVDRGSGREVVFYGQSTLLAAGLGGPALRLTIIRVSIDFDSEYEQLAAACLALKGHYDGPRKRPRGMSVRPKPQDS
jgi:hypothetical protein